MGNKQGKIENSINLDRLYVVFVCLFNFFSFTANQKLLTFACHFLNAIDHQELLTKKYLHYYYSLFSKRK